MLIAHERILEYFAFSYATFCTVRFAKHRVGPCYKFRLNFVNVKYQSSVSRKTRQADKK